MNWLVTRWKSAASVLSAVVLFGAAWATAAQFSDYFPVTARALTAAQAEDARARDQLASDVGELKELAIDGQIADRFGELMDVRLKLAEDPRNTVLRQYERSLVRDIRRLENQRAITSCQSWQLIHDSPCPPGVPSVLSD